MSKKTAAVALPPEIEAKLAELDALRSEHAEVVEALKTERAEAAPLARKLLAAQDKLEALQSDLEAAKLALTKAQAAKPADAVVPFGAISLPHGILVLADQKFYDEKWSKPTESLSAVAVDFIGPDAEYLARRQKDITVQTLVDGTLRVVAPDRPRAQKLKSDADQWCQENARPGNRISLTPIRSTKLVAQDCARARGVGVAEVEGLVMASALTAEGFQATVSAVMGTDGKPVELRVRLR